jgi:hypothetical protein
MVPFVVAFLLGCSVSQAILLLHFDIEEQRLPGTCSAEGLLAGLQPAIMTHYKQINE